MHPVEKKVLKRIEPAWTERKKVANLLQDLLAAAKQFSGHDVVVAGSIGKDTWLTGDHDIDLFVLFPKDVAREQLEKEGLAIGDLLAKKFRTKAVRKYAEHPYTMLRIKSYDIDVVPCYEMKEGESIQSAVDRSPLHLKFIERNLTKEMKNEVRLLKQFCKGIGVYGSDAKHNGISGYVCELLIHAYKTFPQAVKAIAAWKPPMVIGTPALVFRQPLVVVDPTDPERNAAAVVSAQNMVKIIAACKEYLHEPTPSFFFPQQQKPLSVVELKHLQERKTRFVAIVAKRPDMIDDNLYPQVRKAAKRLEQYLHDQEFRVLRSLENAEHAIYIIFELEVWHLPAIKSMVGPPIYDHANASNFLKKYSNPLSKPYVKDDRWVAEKKREFEDASESLETFLRQKDQVLGVQGIPQDLVTAFKKSSLYAGERFWKLVKKNKDLSRLLQQEYRERFTRQ